MNKKFPSSFLTFSATAHLVIKSILITTILLSTTQPFVIAKANYGSQLVEANVLYVAAVGNCGVAVPCFIRIQDAIDTASIGDTIKVAQGVYFVSLDIINEVIYINKPITLQGGYTITDWDNPLPETNITWIDAQHNRRGIYINSIDNGLVIINGLRIINGGDVFDGAGIYINQGNVSVADSIVSNNKLDSGKGAGIYVGNLGVLTLEKSIVENNSINRYEFGEGGGLAALGGKVTLRNNVFRNNVVAQSIYSVGAGVWSQNTELTVENNRFENNQLLLASTKLGGAIFYLTNIQSLQIVLSHNYFINNTNGVWIEAREYLSGACLEGNFFLGNPLYIEEGVVTAENDIFSDNVGNGVILGREGEGSVTAMHWTIASNTSNGISGSGMQMNLSNSIIAYNGSYGIAGGNISANEVLFFNNGSNCGGNTICTSISIGDPKFADLYNRDYHILPGSMAQDQGSDVGSSVDIDGETRPIGLGYDLGADEIPLPPTASFTSSSPHWIGFSTTFTNTSQSTGAVSYLWSFGDGTFSEEFSPQHQYLNPGIYTGTLTVNNYGGSDSTEREVMVYGAVFNATNPVWLGQEIIFSNASVVDDLTIFEWNFGDGETSTEVNPRHIYSVPGIYTVTLLADGIEGSSSTLKDIVVYSEPTANFSSTITTGFAPLNVEFISTSYTTPPNDPSLLFLWDFGDGGTSSQENPFHTYQSAGVYSVSLTVTNAAGSNTKVREEFITVKKIWYFFLPLLVNNP